MNQKVLILSLLCFFRSFLYGSDVMEKAEEEGRLFGKQKVKECQKNIKDFSIEELLPEGSGLSDVDPDQLRKNVLENTSVSSDIADWIKNNAESSQPGLVSSKEGFFENSDKVTKNPNQSITSNFISKQDKISPAIRYVKCNESGDPFLLSCIRQLRVDVKHIPVIEEKIKKCLGHEIIHKGKKKEELLNKTIKDRSNFKSYNLSIHEPMWSSYITVTETFAHLDDISECDNYYINKILIAEEKWEEMKDEWIYEDPSKLQLSQSPDCVFLSRKCLDENTEKIIEGKPVKRPCWREELFFQYFHPEIKGCNLIGKMNAELIDKKCIKDTPDGCALWELTFKVTDNNQLGSYDLYNPLFYNKENSESSNINQVKFNEIIAKLSVFEEMKTDLEGSGDAATKAIIFKGSCFKCNKNILDNVLYDCCFNMKGGAIKAKLAKCTAEEIALAEKRERGLCHYIGYYKEKFLDVLWKSRDVHVFCCFPSKLSRVLQEQARKQFKKSWGTPENPDCRGFKVEEITSLNFEKMDLSEIYEDIAKKVPLNLEEKLKSFQEKIRIKLEKESENLDKNNDSNGNY